MWQDWVLSLITWVFALSLLPTMFSKTQKPTLSTSLLTTLGNAVIAFVFTTLGLWSAFAGALAVTLAWGILTVQRWSLDRESK